MVRVLHWPSNIDHTHVQFEEKMAYFCFEGKDGSKFLLVTPKIQTNNIYSHCYITSQKCPTPFSKICFQQISHVQLLPFKLSLLFPGWTLQPSRFQPKSQAFCGRNAAFFGHRIPNPFVPPPWQPQAYPIRLLFEETVGGHPEKTHPS